MQDLTDSSCSAQPIGWLYPTEIQPLEIRAAAASLNTASNMVRLISLAFWCPPAHICQLTQHISLCVAQYAVRAVTPPLLSACPAACFHCALAP